MLYLTYEEYRSLGGQLSEAAFLRIISRVSGIISNATHSRIEKMSAVPMQVKALAMDLIDYCNNNSLTQKNVVSKSQSAGGLSESESYGKKGADEQGIEIEALIFDHLMSVKDDNGTPLLYRGAK